MAWLSEDLVSPPFDDTRERLSGVTKSVAVAECLGNPRLRAIAGPAMARAKLERVGNNLNKHIEAMTTGYNKCTDNGML